MLGANLSHPSRAAWKWVALPEKWVEKYVTVDVCWWLIVGLYNQHKIVNQNQENVVIKGCHYVFFYGTAQFYYFWWVMA